MLPPVVLADYAGIVESSDHSEVRLRSTQGVSIPVGVDLSTEPLLRVYVHDRRWEYTLGYRPLFILEDVEQGFSFLQLNNANAAIAWHDRFARVEVTEDGGYGTTNSAVLSQPASPSGTGPATGMSGMPGTGVLPTTAVMPQAAAVPQTITTLASTSALHVTVRADRSTSVTARIAYLVSGGIDPPSQAVIPQEHGPRAEAAVTVVATRRAQIVSSAYAQEIDFTSEPCFTPTGIDTTTQCKPQALVIQGAEGIRYAVDRRTALSADVGGTFSRSRDRPTAPYAIKPFPNATASVTYAFAERGRGSFQVVGDLAPVIDYRTGFVSNRLGGEVRLSVPVTRRLLGHAAAFAAQTVPTDEAYALTLYGSNADLELEVSRSVTLSLGERFQYQTEAPFPAFFSAFGYIGVTARAPALRF